MTGVPLNPTFLLLALAIVGASGWALWWLLRGESRRTLVALAVVTALAVALRVAHVTDFPTGLNEDEPKVLYAAGRAVERNTLLAESNISVPILPHALFQGQLIPLLGPWRWAIRTYSLAGGVLCIPAGFAAARALHLATVPSVAVAGLIAVLPWALFYSRVMTGCELTFFQLLYVAALARLILNRRAISPATAAGAPAGELSARVGWREWALATFALGWMLYGYWPTRAMAPLALVAALLASNRARLWSAAIVPAALLLYAPYVFANRHSMFISQGVDAGMLAAFADPLALMLRLRDTLGALLLPWADDGWLTIRSAAMHPFWLLAVAAVGVAATERRALFLGAGFVLGLAPSVFAWGPPSTHRMLMAYPFVALAAGAAIERLASPRAQRLAAGALVLSAGVWSVHFYFSETFWPPESRRMFDGQRTALIESLPPPNGLQVVFMRQVSYFRDPRRLIAPRDAELTVNNWLPDGAGAVYAFTWEARPLRAFYADLLGAERIRSFGDAFTVTLEPGDWSWVRRHGWAYTARCNDDPPRHGQIPVLFQPLLTFADFPCEHRAVHRWRARWDGPPTSVRIRASAPMLVETNSSRLESDGGENGLVEFTAEPGTDIRVTVTTPPFQPWVFVSLTETDGRLPAWDRATPVFEDF